MLLSPRFPLFFKREEKNIYFCVSIARKFCGVHLSASIPEEKKKKGGGKREKKKKKKLS